MLTAFQSNRVETSIAKIVVVNQVLGR